MQFAYLLEVPFRSSCDRISQRRTNRLSNQSVAASLEKVELAPQMLSED
jgi:hypothetical protein